MEQIIDRPQQDDINFDISTNKKPLLSIIVPVYNAEKYLAQCLDSILNQEFSDFEALCVNDGSTDRSGQILEEYACRDSRIKTFHTTNLGVSHARNYALAIASGSFIGFVDSDDWIDPDHYAILMRCFDDPHIDMGICKVLLEKEDADKKYCRQDVLRENSFEELTRVDTINAISNNLEVWGYCPNKVFKKEKIYSFFNEEISLAEDRLFCCQYAYGIEKAVFVKSKTYHYRSSVSDLNWLFKNPKRISGLRALILIIELLSRDVELTKNRDETIKDLFNWYFNLSSHYRKERNVVAIAVLKGYSKELRRYLRLFWTSPNYETIEKIKSTFKVCLPCFWSTVRRFL